MNAFAGGLCALPAFALPAILPQGAAPAPKAESSPDEALEKFRKEEADELSKIAKDLAEKHSKLAKWCEKMRMGRRARFHHLRALSYYPDHESSRKALGFKKTGSVWAEPKEASFKVEDDEKISPPDNPDELTSEWKSFEAQLQPILQFRADKDLKLAEKAKKLGLASEEERILRRITEYWPDSVEARKRLNHDRIEREAYAGEEGKVFRAHIAWIEAAFEKIYDGIKLRGPLKEASEEEQKLALPFMALESEHFRIAASVSEEFARGYLQAAEAGWQALLSLCPDVPMPRKDFPIRLYALGSVEEYRKALEALIRVGKKELANLVTRPTYGDPVRHISYQESLNENRTDLFFHKGAEYAMETVFPRLSPWFQEGLAYFITHEMHGYASTTCISYDKGTQVEIVDHWRENKSWRPLLLESVMLKDDPSVTELFKATFNKLRSRGGVKAWSVVHFLRQRDPALFHELLKMLGSKIDPAPAIEQIYKLDAKMLDEQWRRWVLESY